MTNDHPWPTELTRAVGRRVKHHRGHGDPMSAEQLAAAVTALGFRYTRAQLANLEAGRRESITLGEVLALAAVLDVPPLLLIFPFGAEQTAEYLPGRCADNWTAALWFTGETPTPGWVPEPRGRGKGPRPVELAGRPSVASWPQRFARNSRPVRLYREHARHVAEWSRWDATGGEAHDLLPGVERSLASTREHMRDLEIIPPELPAELAHVDQVVQP